MTRPKRHLRRSFAAFGVLVALLLSGCGDRGKNEDELIGLIVDVRGRGDDVRSFTLRSGDQNYEIRIAPDVNYGFQLSHLRLHVARLLPVLCKLERRDGQLYALEIVDV